MTLWSEIAPQAAIQGARQGDRAALWSVWGGEAEACHTETARVQPDDLTGAAPWGVLSTLLHTLTNNPSLLLDNVAMVLVQQ